MKCPHCNQEHADSLRFCPYTGQEIEQLEHPLACGRCGAELPPRMRFCPACGEPAPGMEETVGIQPGALSGISAPTTVPRPVSKKEHGFPLIGGIFISLLVLAAAVIFGIGLATAGDRIMGISPTSLPVQTTPVPISSGETATVPAQTAEVLQPTGKPTSTPEILEIVQSTPSPTMLEILLSPTLLPTETPVPPTATPASFYAQYDLAFASDRSGAYQIYLMESDNPEDWAVVPYPDGYEKASWPTFCDQQLAYEVEDQQITLPRWIYLYDTIQDVVQPLIVSDPTVGRVAAPSCSPAADYLAFSGYRNGKWSLDILQLNENSLVFDLPGGDYPNLGYATWFPNGKDFMWMGFRRTGFVDVIQTLHFLDGGETSVFAQGRYPAISPDGKYLAYFCGNLFNLCITELQTGKVVHEQVIHYIRQINERQAPASAAWSSDSNWVYFVSSVTGNWDLYRMHPDGSGLVNLTEGWPSDELMPATR